MRRLKQDSAVANVAAQEGDSFGFPVEDDADDAFDTYEIYRVTCPDCRQPIALLADEDTLPEHALCPSPWNPFALAVCQGSGRPASDAPDTDDMMDTHEQDAAILLTLPEGLDWRRQPFSHPGGPGERAARVPRSRRRS